jgi:hypothetical protein
MMTFKMAFIGALGAAVLSAPNARANSCSWTSPYDGQTYNGITVQSHGGNSLSDPRVVIDFWGSLNPSNWCYNAFGFNGYDTTLGNQTQTMLNDPNFWDRLSQYGVFSGGVVGVYYGGQYATSDPSLCNATLSEQQIRQGLDLEQYYGNIPVDFNNQYIYLVFLGDDVTSPVVSGGGRHDQETNPYLLNYNYPYGYVEISTYATDTLVAAHEAMEEATDPFTVDTNFLASPGYWAYPPAPGYSILEIGDLCNGRGEVVNGVRWQRSWFQDVCACQ